MEADMAPTIDVAFVEEYNADVHMLFRQMGSRLMNTTRKGYVNGDKVYFQRFGMLAAQQKQRNGQHDFLDADHTRVSADMADWYVPTLVDKLDVLKLNINERQAHATAHVAAMGKKTDEILIAAMEAGAHATDLGDATKAFNFDMAMAIITTFTVNEVPDDGRRFCALHPYAWAQLLEVDQFANADYVGQDALPFKGMTGKYWMGTLWFPLANVSLSAGNVATNLAWHQSVVGHGVNSEIETTWDYENTYSAWSCVSSMSLGATIIEDTGMFTIESLSPLPAA
jgi:hypothetical protein